MTKKIFTIKADHNGDYLEIITYEQWIKAMEKYMNYPIKMDYHNGMYFILNPITGINLGANGEQEAINTYNQTLIEIAENERKKGKGYQYFETLEEISGSYIGICYARIKNPISNHMEKVMIPYNEGITEKEVEKQGRRELSKKQEYFAELKKNHDDNMQKKNEIQRQNHISQRTVYESVYGNDQETEEKALLRWKEIGFLMPAPTQIRDIKKSMKLSWNALIAYTNKISEWKENNRRGK